VQKSLRNTIMYYKTRVVKNGLRWYVESFKGSMGWNRYPFAFGTRNEARKAQFLVSQI